MPNISLCTTLCHRALCSTRGTLSRVRPVHLGTKARLGMSLAGRVGVPVSLCTLLVKPDMSYAEIVTAPSSTLQTGLSARQAGFAKRKDGYLKYLIIETSCHFLAIEIVSSIIQHLAGST
eukprot:TRINITY_DN66936_c0_g1_i1.p1 TRINITY_DN66936_c0_g1~~TRINITY_DN66936_c0_g1_i1.p1  ORF type:complete len:120 (+),score=29.25 TRINITY_DN66936_c0_g1_i1:36-395(+)